MDAALLSMMQAKGRNKAWVEGMVNLEARKLVNTANTLSSYHLQDGLTRTQFINEIKAVIEQQFKLARMAKTDEECIACIQTLREEAANLREQDRMLRMKTAQLYAKVEFVRENNKIVGYAISAVHVALSGVSVVIGATMMATMNPIGLLVGAVLVADGANGLSKEAINVLSNGQAHSEGVLADEAMHTAQYMGFRPESGLAFYNAVTLTADAYSIFGAFRKPGAWRLFRWLPRDYYRKVDSMGKPKLAMKIVGYGLKAKVSFDLLTINHDTR